MMDYIWKYMRKDQKGFTLVELLVVVVILGILSTLAVQTIGNKTEAAKKAKVDADLRTVMSALELYRMDATDGKYPAVNQSMLKGELVPKYLQSFPKGTITYTVNSKGDAFYLKIDLDGKTAEHLGIAAP